MVGFGGVRCTRDDDIFVGLELGYFAEKMKPFGKTYNPPIPDLYRIGDRINCQSIKFKMENFSGVCNVTLRRDFGERSFLHCGVGAGVVRRILRGSARKTGDAYVVPFDRSESAGEIRKWQFFGSQGFAGFGWYLNDNWQLTVGYCLRYVSDNIIWLIGDGVSRTELGMKQKLIHAAEVGLMYLF